MHAFAWRVAQNQGPLEPIRGAAMRWKGDESPACLAEESAWELGWEEGWN